MHGFLIWAYSSVGQSARLISVRSVVQIYLGPPALGAVAQLGERRLCKADVVGSSPISSTKIWGDDIRGSGSLQNDTEMRGVDDAVMSSLAWISVGEGSGLRWVL